MNNNKPGQICVEARDRVNLRSIAAYLFLKRLMLMVMVMMLNVDLY